MGRALGAALDRAIDRAAGDGSRSDVIQRMGDAAGIDSGTVNQIVSGTISCPPLERLTAFARVLPISAASLRSAAGRDGCEYEAQASYKPNLLAIEAPVTIEAAAGDDVPARFSVVAYTGGAIQPAGWDLPVVVDLQGMTFGNNLVANLDHDPTKRVGNVTSSSVDGGQLILSGNASAANPARTEVVESAAAGFTWQASIEAKPDMRTVRSIKAGKSVEVNGQTHEGPLYVAGKTTLKGFAFVSHGADDHTSVDIAATAADTREVPMRQEVRKWIEASYKLSIDDLNDEQIEAFEAQYDGLNKPAPSVTLDDAASEIRAESDRQQAITDVMRREMLNPANVHNQRAIEAMAREAIDAKKTATEFELELLRESRGVNTITTRQTENRTAPEVIEAALCLAGGLDKPEELFPEQVLDAADKKYRRSIGLKQVILEAAQGNGYTGHDGGSADAFRHAFTPDAIHATSFSTVSLPGIFSNVANKFLARGWNYVETAWGSVSSTRSARDFKQLSTYSLTGLGKTEQVPAGGEIKHGTPGEVTYTNQVDTYGLMLSVDRRDIINDDLGALTDVALKLGRGAGLAMNDVFWTEFLDNSTFFSVGNDNLLSGAGSALDPDGVGLAAAEVALAKQTDPDGNPLGWPAAILLVPTELMHTAMRLMQSELSIGNTDRVNANIFQGRFQVVPSTYLSNANYTGQSATAWYLLTQPTIASTIEVAFLNGMQAPTIETGDTAFNNLGIQQRVYHDFGVNKQEYRAGIKSAGA